MSPRVLLTPLQTSSFWRGWRQFKTTAQRTLFFPFSTGTQTLHVVLERLLHQIGSCCAAADNANMFFVPSKIAHHLWQKRFRTNSINNMRSGRTKFLVLSHETDRITRFLHCLRHSNFHVMERFGLSCHNMLCGVTSWLFPRDGMPFSALACHSLSNYITVVVRKAPP